MGVVKRQGIKNTISSYLGIIIGFLSLIVIQPKFLSTEVIGLSRVLLAFSSLIGTIIPLGASNLAIRYFPRFFNPSKNHHGFLGFLLLFPIVGSLFTFLILFIFKELINAQYIQKSPLFAEYFFYVFPFCISIGFTSIFNAYLSSIYKSTIPAYLNDVVIRVLYIIIILLFYYDIINLHQFISLFVLTYVFQVIVMGIYMLLVGNPSLKIDWEKLKSENINEITGFGLVVSVAGFASLGLNTIDSVILGAYGLSTLGIYTVVAFIPTVIQTPLVALDRITAPKISFALHENDTNEIKTIYYKSCKYLFILGVFLTVNINLNIEALLSMIKPEYMQALYVVPIVSIGYLINMLGGVNTSILFYSAQKWESAFLLITAFGITVILDLIFIPIIGMKGAAFAISATAFIYNFIKWYLIKKRFGLQPYDSSYITVLLAGIVSFIIPYIIPISFHPIINIIIKGSISTVLFTSLIVYFNIIPFSMVMNEIKKKF
jgi:O-antigen/teichoic acid export membrane protein